MRATVRARMAAAALVLLSAISTAHGAEDEIETVLVSGEQPGPGLWKISRGDHVLWILGGSGLLPKDMVWRSGRVEALIAESQEVLFIGNTRVSPDIGLFRALTLLPSMLKAGKNPDGKKLKDVVPASSYEKWRRLREKYLGSDDGIEKWRPTFALGQLREAAIRKSGLSAAQSARAIVSKAARKHDVRVTQPATVERQIHVDDPRGLLKKLANRDFADAECFDGGLDRLEPQIEEARLFANAWATGDIDALRTRIAQQKSERGSDPSCEELLLDALADEPGAKELVASVKAQADVAARAQDWNWLQSARKALATNRSTFAVLPMQQLFDADGYVEKLRAEGYEVAPPP